MILKQTFKLYSYQSAVFSLKLITLWLNATYISLIGPLLFKRMNINRPNIQLYLNKLLGAYSNSNVTISQIFI